MRQLITANILLISVFCTSADEPPLSSRALQEFLHRFDRISERGFVQTLRSGPTGVGYTLESLIGVRENNSPRGDLLGMEIKAYRDDETFFDDQSKMNLFLKEPTWTDDLTAAERIQRYGYVGKFQRKSWYQSVTSKTNAAGLALRVNEQLERVELTLAAEVIAYWDFTILQQRLTEKLSQIAFVAAAARGKGKNEEFHFRTVTWCSNPDIQSFVKLIDSADVILELRMHLRENGSARNHGSAFRVKKHRIRELFAQCVQCRPFKVDRPQ